MSNTIILKRSSTPNKVPTTSQLALGEIAINTYNGRVFIKKDDGTPAVVEIGGVTSVNTYGGDVVLGTDDIAETGSTNQYFTTARARDAVSAGTGISYNSSTGVITTSQSITTSASPTFAGLTLTGNATTRSIIPSANNTYSLGSATMQWKDLYVGPGTLYVNGKAVISDTSGTMTFSTDVDQNMRLTTTGTGVLQLGSSSTVTAVSGTLQIQSGKNITDSAGTAVGFGNAIQMNGSKVIGLGTPSANTDAATKAYVDSTVGALSTSSITKGDSNVTVTDNGTGTVTVTVDGSTALTVDASGVTVAGNFTVSGTTTTVNSNTIALADNIITLNSDATGAPTQNAGIEVERGDEANVQLRWNEGSQKWTFTNNGATYVPMATSTDDLTEGSTNQYFSTTRARTAINASSATGVSYNSSTGAISLGSIPNSSITNHSITINGTSVDLGGTRTLTTDDVADTGATNKYFTNAQARNAVSVTGTGLSYNSGTGVISSNATNANTASTVVARDASGNFTAGTITAALTGNASTASALASARTIALTGDATASGSFDGSANFSQALTLATVNSNVGSYGSATAIPVITVNAKGLVTGVSTTAVSIPSGALTFTGDVTGSGTTGSSTALSISALVVTNAMLAGSIANSKLTNSSVTVGSTAISLGSSATTIAGLTSVTSTSFVGALTGNATTVTNGVYTTDVGTVTSTMIADGTITNGDINASAGIVDTKLATISTGGKVSNSATTATSANTASAIVARDASGNFTAGTITAALTGNVTGNVTGTSGSTTGNAATVTNGVYTTDTGTVTSTMIADGTIVNGDINASAAIAYSKLALTGAILNADLAGSIANTKLANSTTTIGTTAIALGGSATIVGGLTSVTSTGFTGALTGNASTATTLATARAIQGVNFDGSAAITVVTAGTGVTVSGTAVSIGQAVGTSSNVTFNDLTVSGNLTVSGTTTSINTATLDVADLNITVAKNAATAAAANGAGLTVNGPATPPTFTYSSADDRWNMNKNLNITTVYGALSGNATTATTLATPRAIQGVNFDGSAAITVVTAGTGISVTGTSVANTGVTSNVAGTGVSVSSGTGASTISIGQSVATSASPTFASVTHSTSGVFNGATSGAITVQAAATAGTNTLTLPATTGTVITTGDSATVTNAMLAGSIADSKLSTISTAGKVSNSATTAASANTASAIVARDASGNFTAGTITAALTGNAGTATTLQTARAINGVSFNGSADVTVHTAGTGISISGTTVTNAGVTSAVAGTYITVSGATGAVTIGTNATNLNTASTLVARDASGNFTAGTVTAALTGNASTATTLQTARAINGVSFNGSADVTVHTAGTGISISGTTVTNSLSTGGGSIGGAIAVTGAITATGEITAYYSDENLKTDIVEIEDPIAKVMSLRGVTFRPNETALALGITDKEEVGVIAQEVEAVLPQLVCPSAFAGYKTVKYEKLTALLIEAVKAQQLQIDALTAQIASLGGSATTEL